MPFRVKICKSFRKPHTPIPTIGVCTIGRTCHPQIVSFTPPVDEIIDIDIEEFNKEYEAFVAEQRRLKAERLNQTTIIENYE